MDHVIGRVIDRVAPQNVAKKLKVQIYGWLLRMCKYWPNSFVCVILHTHFSVFFLMFNIKQNEIFKKSSKVEQWTMIEFLEFRSNLTDQNVKSD